MAKRGRPKKDPKEKKAGNISTRLRGDLRDRLQEAANLDRRTLSDEIARRLEDSFTETDRLMERVGGAENLALLMLIAESLKDLHSLTTQAWHRDRFTFDHALQAIVEVLSYFQPEGRAKPPANAFEGPDFPYGPSVARKAIIKNESAYREPDTRPEREVYKRIAQALDARLTRIGAQGSKLFSGRNK